MGATEKCTMIREMVDRLVRAECNCTAWADEMTHSTTQCEKDRAKAMYDRAVDSRYCLRRDFDETLEELMHG